MNISKGYKLVPVEPTDEMLYAASWVHGPGGIGEVKRRIGLEYRAALSVAPTPPQPIYDDSSIRGWEVGSRLFRQRLEAHKYITSGQSHVDGNGSKLEPLYRAKAGEVL